MRGSRMDRLLRWVFRAWRCRVVGRERRLRWVRVWRVSRRVVVRAESASFCAVLQSSSLYRRKKQSAYPKFDTRDFKMDERLENFGNALAYK